MSFRVLVTSSSFTDTPGPHRDKLRDTGYELVSARGPLSEVALLQLISSGDKFDAYLCGEDDFSVRVLESAAPRAKIISKYGVGLDKINIEAAERLGIKVTNTPGTNHTTVTELTFGLLLSLARHIPEHSTLVHQASWKRITGSELQGKTLGICGFGRVGKEVARRALAFGMRVLVFNTSWSAAHQSFCTEFNALFGREPLGDAFTQVQKVSLDELLAQSDFVSLHMNLTRDNARFFDRRRIWQCKRGAYVINVSRGGLVDQDAVAEAITKGQLAGFAADVLEPEPVTPHNPLLNLPNVVLTPHIGSRTLESIARQGAAAVDNIIAVLGIAAGAK
jgi:D-3-phosphoglycerate dehydrogenase / 2-oxoglutarate reductase